MGFSLYFTGKDYPKLVECQAWFPCHTHIKRMLSSLPEDLEPSLKICIVLYDTSLCFSLQCERQTTMLLNTNSFIKPKNEVKEQLKCTLESLRYKSHCNFPST